VPSSPLTPTPAAWRGTFGDRPGHRLLRRPPDGEAPAELAPYAHAILTGSEAGILADTV